MDRLIKATKDSDHKELQALTGLGSEDLVDYDELIESECEEEEEVRIHTLNIILAKHKCAQCACIYMDHMTKILVHDSSKLNTTPLSSLPFISGSVIC